MGKKWENRTTHKEGENIWKYKCNKRLIENIQIKMKISHKTNLKNGQENETDTLLSWFE